MFTLGSGTWLSVCIGLFGEDAWMAWGKMRKGEWVEGDCAVWARDCARSRRADTCWSPKLCNVSGLVSTLVSASVAMIAASWTVTWVVHCYGE